MDKFEKILQQHPQLQSRITTSRKKLIELRKETMGDTALKNKRLSIFAAGSLGRLEIGTRSDFDVFMIANQDNESLAGEQKPSISRLEEYEVFASLIRINNDLGFPKFSGDGKYLKTYELAEMLKATGSPRDDSENLFTARVLLMLESQFVTNDILYKYARSRVISHYYRDDKDREDFRPLFLLNDLLRFWRTLCLNYEVHRNETGHPWLKKNLNLKFSRKLTIFSAVLGILSGKANDANSFTTLCDLTPIERLASALDAISDPELEAGFEEALRDYEDFLSAKENWTPPLETDNTKKTQLTKNADRFGQFFHKAINSKKINENLRKYVLI